MVYEKTLCGSTLLYKGIEGFVPNDTDYILFTDSDVIFEHKVVNENECNFIWGKDKKAVRNFLLKLPYYMSSLAIVTKRYVEYYEYSDEDVTKIIDRFIEAIENSKYRYYVPILNYIKDNMSWDFPDSVIEKSYNIYKVVKNK